MEKIAALGLCDRELTLTLNSSNLVNFIKMLPKPQDVEENAEVYHYHARL